MGIFCAVCEERAYFLPETLTIYRIHGTNESSPIENRRNLIHRIKKYKKAVASPCLYSTPLYEQSTAMLARMEKYELNDCEKAYKKAHALFNMSMQLREAEMSGRIKGCILLLKLHDRNALYHEVGMKQLTAHMLNILLHKKEKRRALL